MIKENAKKGIEYCFIIKGDEKCLNLSLFCNDVLNWFFCKWDSYQMKYIEYIEFTKEEKIK